MSKVLNVNNNNGFFSVGNNNDSLHKAGIKAFLCQSHNCKSWPENFNIVHLNKKAMNCNMIPSISKHAIYHDNALNIKTQVKNLKIKIYFKPCSNIKSYTQN